MRTHYRNGDEITLGGCDGCTVMRINGVLCHEPGCPDAWRDYSVECKECGCDFYPDHRGQQFCGTDCYEAYNCIGGEYEAEAAWGPEDEPWDGDENGNHSWGTGLPGQNLSCFI